MFMADHNPLSGQSVRLENQSLLILHSSEKSSKGYGKILPRRIIRTRVMAHFLREVESGTIILYQLGVASGSKYIFGFFVTSRSSAKFQGKQYNSQTVFAIFSTTIN
jgi:hypothetical protein